MVFILIKRKRTADFKNNASFQQPKPAAGAVPVVQPHRVGKKAYIGQWEGDGISLEITWQGSSRRECVGKHKFEIQEGAICFSGNAFSIESMPAQLCTVQVPPHRVGHHWQMTVDDMIMRKIDDGFRWLKAIGKDNFEGYWECVNMSVEIHANGNATFIKFPRKNGNTIAGKIKFTKNGFVIGNAAAMQLFEIEQAPLQQNNQWYMTVNGEKMKRIQNHVFSEPEFPVSLSVTTIDSNTAIASLFVLGSIMPGNMISTWKSEDTATTNSQNNSWNDANYNGNGGNFDGGGSSDCW
jgi:hypothetical protein